MLGVQRNLYDLALAHGDWLLFFDSLSSLTISQFQWILHYKKHTKSDNHAVELHNNGFQVLLLLRKEKLKFHFKLRFVLDSLEEAKLVLWVAGKI